MRSLVLFSFSPNDLSEGTDRHMDCGLSIKKKHANQVKVIFGTWRPTGDINGGTYVFPSASRVLFYFQGDP